MADREFSRRVNVYITKDEPDSREQFAERIGVRLEELTDERYQLYLDRHQPYRWRAVGANNRPLAPEAYFNESDAINTANLLFGEDTTVYLMPMYGEDRSEKVLRFGATDRKNMEPPF